MKPLISKILTIALPLAFAANILSAQIELRCFTYANPYDCIKTRVANGLTMDARESLQMIALTNQNKSALETVGGRIYQQAFATTKTHNRQKLIGNDIILKL